MRKLLPLMLGVAIAGGAGATAETTIYKITKIDAAGHTLTLASGKAYSVAPAIKLDGFKVGDRVRVTFTTDGKGSNIATAVASAS